MANGKMLSLFLSVSLLTSLSVFSGQDLLERASFVGASRNFGSVDHSSVYVGTKLNANLGIEAGYIKFDKKDPISYSEPVFGKAKGAPLVNNPKAVRFQKSKIYGSYASIDWFVPMHSCEACLAEAYGSIGVAFLTHRSSESIHSDGSIVSSADGVVRKAVARSECGMLLVSEYGLGGKLSVGWINTRKMEHSKVGNAKYVGVGALFRF